MNNLVEIKFCEGLKAKTDIKTRLNYFSVNSRSRICVDCENFENCLFDINKKKFRSIKNKYHANLGSRAWIDRLKLDSADTNLKGKKFFMLDQYERLAYIERNYISYLDKKGYSKGFQARMREELACSDQLISSYFICSQKLIPEVKRLWKKEGISLRIMRFVAMAPSESQEKLLQHILGNGLGCVKVERLIKKLRKNNFADFRDRIEKIGEEENKMPIPELKQNKLNASVKLSCPAYRTDITFERCINNCSHVGRNKDSCSLHLCEHRLCLTCVKQKPEGFSFNDPEIYEQCKIVDKDEGRCELHLKKPLDFNGLFEKKKLNYDRIFASEEGKIAVNKNGGIMEKNMSRAEKEAEIKKLLEEGIKSPIEIAKIAKVSVQTIHNHRRKLDLDGYPGMGDRPDNKPKEKYNGKPIPFSARYIIDNVDDIATVTIVTKSETVTFEKKMS